MYKHLLQRHRKAWSCHCCLSPHPYPHKEILIKYSGRGDSQPGTSMFARGHGVLASHEGVSPVKLTGGEIGGGAVKIFESVQCIPLASLLLALNTTHVHFVSLDVEGAEESILHSFPWHRITVDVWLVEHISKTSYDPQSQHNSPTQINSDTEYHTIPKRFSSADKEPVNHRSHRVPDRFFHNNDEKSAASNFVKFFMSRGYDLYPKDPASLLDNYLFVRRGSQVHHRLNVFKTT